MTSTPFINEPLTVSLWSLKAVRFRIAILIALAMMIQAMLRNNLNMALVCMVRIDESAPDLTLNSSKSVDLCGRQSLHLNASLDQQLKEASQYVMDYQVDWSMPEQGRIHSFYYVGSLVSVFVTSRLCDRFGAKHLITFGVIVNAIGTLLTPVAAILLPRYEIICLIRFLMGFAQGFLIPCGSLIVAKWFTLHEKSTAMAIFTTGNQIGLALAMFFTAKMCQLDFFGGWPVAFFLSGVVSLFFLVVWIPFAADRPRDSRYITAAELDHINGQSVKHRAMSINISTPYKKILLCPVVLAICLCSFCQSFVIVSLATYLPQYNQSALKLDISSNGIWTSIPFIVQMFTKFLFAFFADYLKKRDISINLITKAFNSLASFGSCICILWISFLGCDHYLLVMSLLCISMGVFSGYVPGYNTSIVSVAPIFTAHISAYAQLYAQAASTIAPVLIGIMTNDGSIDEWSKVFYLLAGVLIVSGAFFQLFGSGTVQKWADIYPPAQTKHRNSARLMPLDQEQAEMDLLAVPHRAKRTPKVSIMEEGDEFPSLPGEYSPTLRDSVVVEDEDRPEK
ncbi:hypothetical protein L596_008236 [Steinernema carpocapsae]|uniref:Major facilitator superfamily (MFS) profile domain-containing protein n=1 Tax=Steinernema carpocapsae TaxID=34508 RepID=A0A4U5PBV0_STECR|nr:hypothetical protein L596_008236 [Steinernema carpocapsae]